MEEFGYKYSCIFGKDTVGEVWHTISNDEKANDANAYAKYNSEFSLFIYSLYLPYRSSPQLLAHSAVFESHSETALPSFLWHTGKTTLFYSTSIISNDTHSFVFYSISPYNTSRNDYIHIIQAIENI